MACVPGLACGGSLILVSHIHPAPLLHSPRQSALLGEDNRSQCRTQDREQAWGKCLLRRAHKCEQKPPHFFYPNKELEVKENVKILGIVRAQECTAMGPLDKAKGGNPNKLGFPVRPGQRSGKEQKEQGASEFLVPFFFFLLVLEIEPRTLHSTAITALLTQPGLFSGSWTHYIHTVHVKNPSTFTSEYFLHTYYLPIKIFFNYMQDGSAGKGDCCTCLATCSSQEVSSPCFPPHS